ncbi:hypothetical protein CLV98_10391 [Dyadobacter jejuensis]|uniref:Uncharacterized protein n=1 Tax=Dyadobacter jejuensis TaxID=1082580 RepID=A0A316ALQ1_9BACT|nr:hypothetical protein CLV98_10391 [Dyadobacter jejuensis]
MLTGCFINNHSVNYLIPQGASRRKRIRNLMDYPFEICFQYGAVYKIEEKTACALVSFPEVKKSLSKVLGLELRLITSNIGLRNIP